jgi:hypothetical protein
MIGSCPFASLQKKIGNFLKLFRYFFIFWKIQKMMAFKSTLSCVEQFIAHTQHSKEIFLRTLNIVPRRLFFAVQQRIAVT